MAELSQQHDGKLAAEQIILTPNHLRSNVEKKPLGFIKIDAKSVLQKIFQSLHFIHILLYGGFRINKVTFSE